MTPAAYQARVAQRSRSAERRPPNPARGRSPSEHRDPRVGSTLIPGVTTTVGDRERVLEQLHTDFAQLQGDIFRAVGWRESHPVADESSPIWTWWESAVRPTVEEWQKFYADQTDSWWTRFGTDWDVYTGWQKRLLALRTLAKKKLEQYGQKLESADPLDVPRTPWEGAGDAARETGHLLKVLGYTAIGVGGAIVLASAIRRGR